MRYLKLYEKFNMTEQDIRDCFQDLEDAGFNIIIEKEENYIFILNDFRSFDIDDIRETLLFAIPYMESEFGLVVNEIKVIDKFKNVISHWSHKLSGIFRSQISGI